MNTACTPCSIICSIHFSAPAASRIWQPIQGDLQKGQLLKVNLVKWMAHFVPRLQVISDGHQATPAHDPAPLFSILGAGAYEDVVGDAVRLDATGHHDIPPEGGLDNMTQHQMTSKQYNSSPGTLAMSVQGPDHLAA